MAVEEEARVPTAIFNPIFLKKSTYIWSESPMDIFYIFLIIPIPN